MQEKVKLSYYAIVAETGFIVTFSERKCRMLGAKYLHGRQKLIRSESLIETVDEVIKWTRMVAGVVLEPNQVLPDQLILYKNQEEDSAV